MYASIKSQYVSRCTLPHETNSSDPSVVYAASRDRRVWPADGARRRQRIKVYFIYLQ